jgi:hypothetical protein
MPSRPPSLVAVDERFASVMGARRGSDHERERGIAEVRLYLVDSAENELARAEWEGGYCDVLTEEALTIRATRGGTFRVLMLRTDARETREERWHALIVTSDKTDEATLAGIEGLSFTVHGALPVELQLVLQRKPSWRANPAWNFWAAFVFSRSNFATSGSSAATTCQVMP